MKTATRTRPASARQSPIEVTNDWADQVGLSPVDLTAPTTTHALRLAHTPITSPTVAWLVGESLLALPNTDRMLAVMAASRLDDNGRPVIKALLTAGRRRRNQADA